MNSVSLPRNRTIFSYTPVIYLPAEGIPCGFQFHASLLRDPADELQYFQRRQEKSLGNQKCPACSFEGRYFKPGFFYKIPKQRHENIIWWGTCKLALNLVRSRKCFLFVLLPQVLHWVERVKTRETGMIREHNFFSSKEPVIHKREPPRRCCSV